VITRGFDLNEFIGKEFEIQRVRFYGTQECAPCYWMDGAFAPGAKDFLGGRGGLRAKIISDGELHLSALPVATEMRNHNVVASPFSRKSEG